MREFSPQGLTQPAQIIFTNAGFAGHILKTKGVHDQFLTFLAAPRSQPSATPVKRSLD